MNPPRLYLLDTSAWAQATYSRRAAAEIEGLALRGLLGITELTHLEILYSARDSKAYRELEEWVTEQLIPVRATEQALALALQRQLELAEQGMHRVAGPIDLVVAAVAELEAHTLLHYDNDFARIADITGQPHRWILPRGTGHGVDAR
ncbi:PIN domain-containing protein [Longispora sp. NPDC051575]|uniref:PIN domain-containing protein n=1 Tax=Longispora sp. NPDC051575 TaxID=3154943 RepID=UPI003436B2AE